MGRGGVRGGEREGGGRVGGGGGGGGGGEGYGRGRVGWRRCFSSYSWSVVSGIFMNGSETIKNMNFQKYQKIKPKM